MTFFALVGAVAALVGLLLAAVWLAGPSIRAIKEAARGEDAGEGEGD